VETRLLNLVAADFTHQQTALETVYSLISCQDGIKEAAQYDSKLQREAADVDHNSAAKCIEMLV